MQSSPEPFEREFLALKEISAQIGKDPMLIQAAGGNTSLKIGDVMWIKASGTLLGDAQESDIFVPVDLPQMRKALVAGEARADMPAQFLLPASSDLRPSIETSLHAVFPQKVVMHAHCIHTLVHAVQMDCLALLEPKLDGLNWALVPYAKPGANLAQLVTKELKPNTDVIILSNHGVIVAGETVAQTIALLYDVHERLSISPRRQSIPELEQLERLALQSEYELPGYLPLHQLALESGCLRMATKGSLYPDHVIFCGIGAHALHGLETLGEALSRLNADGVAPPVFLIVPEQGVVVRKGASSGAHALMRCLADILVRMPENANLRYLTGEQNGELLDWDSEKYRQALNAD